MSDEFSDEEIRKLKGILPKLEEWEEKEERLTWLRKSLWRIVIGAATFLAALAGIWELVLKPILHRFME